MIELHLPWIELSLLAPLVGLAVSFAFRSAELHRIVAICSSLLSFVLAFGAWEDFNTLQVFEAHDRWDLVTPWLGGDSVVVDEFNAPLLMFTSMMYFLTAFATLRTKVKRFPFRASLFSQFVVLATLACRDEWGIVGLLGLQIVPVMFELRNRKKSDRGFAIHMLLFLGLMIGGLIIHEYNSRHQLESIVPVVLITIAVLIRSGCVPFHCWMPDLFEKATLGSALLFVSPLLGAYAAVRILLPIAPDWALQFVALASLLTSVYAAGMALVQTEARRFFCYLLLSNSSLVLVGLEVATPIGLTGALCAWLAVLISVFGFGLTLRAVESRVGKLSLKKFHGLYDQMPLLASFFLLTGLAIVGFPGTIGFAGVELIVEGAVEIYPYVGAAVVVAAALNGIAILRAYFRIFTGSTYKCSFCMKARWPEKVAVLVLSTLILVGGIFPNSSVQSRYHAAKEIMSRRQTDKRQKEEQADKNQLHPSQEK